ncbi:MAG: GGDEF domain-containing protein [Thiohalophilus sp.]|uniref:GGDEF domain-containing protein n=1 Tax=Thiohalophilus sp. TaxID=3028392 RepID=UPI00286FCAA6|nr:GGDEF domain-containing protein [Thiohalophilus sp.]MDR9435600.1 GGDEF domain-containing protein [Thiohalophilus sp.]
MSASDNKGADALTGENRDRGKTSVSSGSADRILNLLDDLKSSTAGMVLYQHVERMLTEHEQEQNNRDQILRFWLRSLLDVYSKHLSPGSSMHLHVKLLQKQLQLPHSSHELKELQRHMDLYALHISRMELIDEAVLRRALEPVLSYYSDEYGNDTALGEIAAKQPVKEEEHEETPPPQHESQRQLIQNLIEELLPHNDQSTEQKLASKYRQYLSSQHRQAEKVQAKLMQHIQETIDENKQFGDMLENVKLGLAEAEEIDDINLLRQSLMEDVAKLGGAYQGLLGKLAEAKQYLKMIETDSQNLSEELARVRLLSMTDELTDLPNRRALMRRLEDEMGRSQRYGFQLALALLDLDSFKAVNDEYGHAVGDTVLTCYADRILTTFRHHDMVARYGGEEFAVILPNTDLEGVLSALRKVQEKAADTICHCGEVDVSTPTFSAGVALLKEDDDVESLLKRADDAMYEAKRLGRNQIIVDRHDRLRAQSAGTQAGARAGAGDSN